ncbi:MAG: hypothetical protein QOF63_4367 [Thermoanaerobaculia bacterium]|nr:hypothetical protein [Thermoanaerobaculia bacterium]
MRGRRRSGSHTFGYHIPHVAALMRATPLFNKKSALALLHSDTGAAAILRNELNAGFLQGPPNGFSNIVGHRGTLPVIPFETLDSRQRALRGLRQLRLGPGQQRAGGSNLFDSNH